MTISITSTIFIHQDLELKCFGQGVLGIAVNVLPFKGKDSGTHRSPVRVPLVQALSAASRDYSEVTSLACH